MIKCFLTSNPIDSVTGYLSTANGFVDKLKEEFPETCQALFICSNPEGYEDTDFYAEAMKICLETAGFGFSRYSVLDRRNQHKAEALIEKSNFIILAGGHVPTQNKFFSEINLRSLLSLFNGTIMGISAGTMNSADIVYAQPELPGESFDTGYQRFMPGLNLTKTMILPHYKAIKDALLDGLRLFEDITYADSMGRKFYALDDGSYLFTHDGIEELHGEAYLIEEGKLAQLLYF